MNLKAWPRGTSLGRAHTLHIFHPPPQKPRLPHPRTPSHLRQQPRSLRFLTDSAILHLQTLIHSIHLHHTTDVRLPGTPSLNYSMSTSPVSTASVRVIGGEQFVNGQPLSADFQAQKLVNVLPSRPFDDQPLQRLYRYSLAPSNRS